MKTKMLFILATLSLGLLIVSCGSDPTPTPEPKPVATATPTPGKFDGLPAGLRAIIEEAKSEGKVNVRTSGFPKEQIELLQNGFQEKFGFPVTIEHFAQHPKEYVTVLAQEAEAGKISSDIAKGGSSPNMLPTIGKGGMQDVDWLGTFGPLFEGSSLEQLKTIHGATEKEIVGHCLADTSSVYGFAYNTERLKKSEIPTTWDGLWDPKVKGLVGMMSGGFPLGTVGINWGEEKILDYAEKTKANEIVVVSGGSVGVVKSVISGETPIGIASVGTALQNKSKGAPIDVVIPSDLIPYFQVNICALKGANQSMAQLFAAWYVAEGRNLFAIAPHYQFHVTDKTGALGEILKAQGVENAPTQTWAGAEQGKMRTDLRGKVMKIWTGA